MVSSTSTPFDLLLYIFLFLAFCLSFFSLSSFLCLSIHSPILSLVNLIFFSFLLLSLFFFSLLLYFLFSPFFLSFFLLRSSPVIAILRSTSKGQDSQPASPIAPTLALDVLQPLWLITSHTKKVSQGFFCLQRHHSLLFSRNRP